MVVPSQDPGPATATGGSRKGVVRALHDWARLTGGAVGLLVALLLVLLAVELSVLRPRVDHILDATLVVRDGHEAMADQQVGLRGFLLSGDERYLESFERGRTELARLTPRAADLLSTGGRTGALYLEMRIAQEAWIEGWALPALASARGDAVAPPDLEEDKARFDEYRASYEGLLDRLVRDRRAAVDARGALLVLTIVLSGAIVLTSGVIAMRQAARLRRSIGTGLDALLHRLERIRGGHLDPEPALAGPAELEAIAAGLEQTAASLARARAEADGREAEIAARNRRQAQVLQLAREVSGSLSMRYVLRGVCLHASTVADGARVVVWLLRDDQVTLDAHADSEGPDLQPLGLQPTSLGTGPVGVAGATGRPSGGGQESLAIPMIVGARVLGVLELTGPEVVGLSSDAAATLETLALHAAGAIGAALLHEVTEQTAVTDVLTGLPNRRKLDADLARECEASRRYGRPLSLLMVDVDHFKAYNDAYGHQAGDVALQSLAGVLGRGLRGTDDAYRYGGEELALILRETPPDEAGALAERLRSAVERHFAAAGEPRPVTISVGVAGSPQHASTPSELIAAADQALYEAKRSGRNRVVVIDQGAGAPRADSPR